MAYKKLLKYISVQNNSNEVYNDELMLLTIVHVLDKSACLHHNKQN